MTVDIINSIRCRIMEEQEAILGYAQLVEAIQSCNDSSMQPALLVIYDIQREERMHVAQLQDLLFRWEQGEMDLWDKGSKENNRKLGV